MLALKKPIKNNKILSVDFYETRQKILLFVGGILIHSKRFHENIVTGLTVIQTLNFAKIVHFYYYLGNEALW